MLKNYPQLERNPRLDEVPIWFITSCSFFLLDERTPYSRHFSSKLPYSGIILAIGAALFPLGQGLDLCVSHWVFGRDVVRRFSVAAVQVSLLAVLPCCLGVCLQQSCDQGPRFSSSAQGFALKVCDCSFLFLFLLGAANGPLLQSLIACQDVLELKEVLNDSALQSCINIAIYLW